MFIQGRLLLYYGQASIEVLSKKQGVPESIPNKYKFATHKWHKHAGSGAKTKTPAGTARVSNNIIKLKTTLLQLLLPVQLLLQVRLWC